MKLSDLTGNYLLINAVIKPLKAKNELIFKQIFISFFKTPDTFNHVSWFSRQLSSNWPHFLRVNGSKVVDFDKKYHGFFETHCHIKKWR